MPGAVRGANGVVHINGDHGVINYMIDGVALPQELNRDIGGEINLNDLSFVDLIEGAYPAQYGLRFGSVFNMSTRAGTGPAGFDGYASFGSYTDAQTTFGYHAPIAGGGGSRLAFSGDQSTRGLDPPNFDSPHNDAVRSSQFARFTLPSGGNNFTNVTFINSHSTFQIPNDVDNGEPASTDDNETQADTFLAVQFHHPIGTTGVDHVRPGVQGLEDPRLRRSDERLHLRRGAQRRGSAVRQRRQIDGLRYGPHRPERRLSSDDVRLFACRPADGDRLHHAGRLQSELRPSHDRGGRLVRSRAISEILRDHAAAEQFLGTDPDAQHARRADDGRRQRPEPRQHLPIVRPRQLAHERLVRSRLRPSLRLLHDQVDRVCPRLRGVQPAAEAHALLRETCEHLCLHWSILRTVLARERQPVGGVSAQPPVAAGRRAIRPEAGTRHAARVRRAYSARLGRPRLSRLAEECQRPHRRHASRRDAAPSGHQLRPRPALAGGAQLRPAAARATDGSTSPSRTSSRTTPDAKRSCWLRASELRPATRRPTTSRAGASRAACCSTIARRLVFGRRRIRQRPVLSDLPATTPPAIASARRIRPSTSKKASRIARRPR